MPRDSSGSIDGPDCDDEESVSDIDGDSQSLSESPSMDFLRDLARVSEQPPGAFDLQLAGADLAPPIPSSQRFQIRQRLGAGGFGTVYEALDREQNATVALKALRRHDGRSIDRFKREFRSLAETVHENLVQLYELHAEGGEWFFTMELVRGTDALSYVRPSVDGPCDEPRLRATFLQLARGLAFLHGTGKLHRDVKPSNVMVSDEGRVVLVDFGLGGDIVELQRVEGVFGTPAYMAPEQAAGDTDRVDARSDIYSLCVLFHELLTLRYYLADKQTLQGLLFAVMNEPPPDLHAARLPQEFIHFLRRGLSKDPAQRFQSVAQMLDELQAIAEGRIHVECAFTAMRRTGNEFNRMVRDRPMMALTAFGLLIGMALFGVVAAVLMIALSR